MKVQEIIEHLKNERENETIEGQLLKRKMIRELYKQLGDPTEEDFGKEMQPAGTWWEKRSGYTTYLEMHSAENMKEYNREPTEWYIKRASGTKMRIVENYTNNGWHARVHAFNVMCTKYVKHPKYENVWVLFYRSRDCAKYEYVIEV